MNNEAKEYAPTRASEKTERFRLAARVDELKDKFAFATGKWESTGDGLHLRQAAQFKKQLAAALHALENFDRGGKTRQELGASGEAADARSDFDKSVAKFEKSLSKLAADSSALLEAAAKLADSSGIREPGRFPHRHLVIRAVTGRAHSVLNGAGLKFDTHAPSRAVGSLVDKWGKQDG